MLKRLGAIFGGSGSSSGSNGAKESSPGASGKSCDAGEEDDDPFSPTSPISPTSPGLGGKYALSTLMSAVHGWPRDVSIIFHHRQACVLVAGTESGTIHAYGRGFQNAQGMLKPTDPNDIISISPLGADKILVGYEDNTLAVFLLPVLKKLCILGPSWLKSSQQRIITSIHVDEPGERSYIYLGTSDGMLYVLQMVMEPAPALRVCEYSVSPADCGIAIAASSQQRFSLFDLQLCPRDERYIALAYGNDTAGVVVLFDLSRMKVHRSFPTAPLTSLVWDHTGSVLYAGTTTGQLLQTSLGESKASSCTCVEIWNAGQERSGFSEDEGAVPAVRKLYWLPPQAAMAPSNGVLFILLGTEYGSNADNLRSVIIGLSPSGSSGSSTMEEVLSLPPLSDDDIVGIRLVPMDSIAEGQGVASTSSAPVSPTSPAGRDEPSPNSFSVSSPSPSKSKDMCMPALLLLTQPNQVSEDYEEDTCRQLRLLQCPTGAVSGWSLEIGTLPEPRCVGEVLVGEGSDGHTCLHAISGQRGSRLHLLSRACRAMVASSSSSAGSLDAEPTMTLASHASTNADANASIDDLLLTGHSSGSVCLWTLRDGGAWQTCAKLEASQTQQPITIIATDPERGLVAAADESGVTVFGAHDASTGESILDVQTMRNIALVAQRESSPTGTGSLSSASVRPSEDGARNGDSGDDDANGEENADDDDDEEEEGEEVGLDPTGLKTLLHVDLPGVSAVLVLGECTTLFLGTRTGELLYSCDWRAQELQPIRYTAPKSKSKSKSKLMGAVVGFTYSSFWLHGVLIPAVYAIFSSGAVLVVHLHTRTVLASCGQKDVVKADSTQSVAFASVVDASLRPLPTPQPFDPYFLHQVHFHSLTSTVPAWQESLAEAPVEGGVPEHGPCKLVVVLNRSVHIYDLSSFAMASRAALLRGEESAPLSAVSGVECVPSQHFVSRHAVASAVMIHVDSDSQATTNERQPALCCFDETGVAVVFSLRSSRPLCASPPMLRGLVEEPCFLKGSVLRSGRVLAQSGGVVFSISLSSAAEAEKAVHFQSKLSTSSTACNTIRAPPPSMCLSTGREEFLAELAIQARKRSSSIMSALPSAFARVDLDKLFSKTRAQLDKEELLDTHTSRGRAGTSMLSSLPEGDEAAGTDSTQTAQRRVQSTLTELGETHEAFRARGEKLAQLNVKSDAMQSAAADYAATIREHRKSLKAKASRWGLF